MALSVYKLFMFDFEVILVAYGISLESAVPGTNQY